MDDALKSQSPALATLKAELGEQKLLAILTLFITDAVEFFNVGKSMTGEQIVQTAKLISKDYYYLKPEDFKLCFENAKRGRYGKLFDRLDGAIVLEWLSTYVNQRMDRAEESNLEKHNEVRFFDSKVRQRHDRQYEEKEREFHKVQVEQFRKESQQNKPTQEQGT